MNNYYADLHIHIGQAGGKWVKITASRSLTLERIIFEDAPRKGLDIVGVVDAGCIPVVREIRDFIDRGALRPLTDGGFLASNGVLFVPACEVESREGVHVISYLPHMESIENWQEAMASHMTNNQLSTQKTSLGFGELLHLTLELKGFFCPAHAFTPHKGVYGKWTPRLEAKLGADIRKINTLELGLSADTTMAEMIDETRFFSFLSNSDAHSSPNVGREYNLLALGDKTFQELKYGLENQKGRRILANFGMDPRLGKYHRSFCSICQSIAGDPPPVFRCPRCHAPDMMPGVYDRIVAIRDHDERVQPRRQPGYFYRVPLQNLPGIGPKTLVRLHRFFDHEINLVEHAPIEVIREAAGDYIAKMIHGMRQGRLPIIPGGGGNYGKVRKDYF